MKAKKSLEKLISGFMLLSLLSGCSTEKVSTGEKSKKVNLKIFIGQGQARNKKQYIKYFDQFVVKYEKGKNVKVTYDLEMPDSNTSDLILKTKLNSGDNIDIFTVHAMNDIPIYGKQGYLEDMSNEPFANKILENIKPSISYQGKVVAVPLENSSWGYLYNKKIFKDNNITVPTTLTEMKAVALKLNRAKVTPFLLAYKDSWVPQLLNSLAVGAYINSSDKDFVDKMDKGAGSYKEISGMFDIMDFINANGTDKPLDLGADAACGDFADGKAAMWIQGPWEAASIFNTNPTFQLGVAALPINDDANATMLNVAVTTSLALSKQSKNKEVAKALLNYILDDNDSSAFYESMKFAPVAKIHKYEVEPYVNDGLAYIRTGRSYIDPTIPQAVKDKVGIDLQGYYLKSLTREDVIQDLDKVWTDSIKTTNN